MPETKTKPKRKPAPVTVTRPDGSIEQVPASRFRRKRTYEFSLTQAQRSALFAGSSPRITVPAGESPFAPGDVYDVPGTRNLSLGIIGIAEGEGYDVLVYRVIDSRGRLLRASVHGVDFDSIRRSYDSRGVPQPLQDEADVAQAAEESAYTTSPGAALKGEPEAISKAAEEDVLERKREKRERQIRSPIAEINRQLSDLEDNPHFTGQANDVRYLRKRVARLEQDALKEAGVE
ncbi:MAG TPA: hypothetical protein VF245_12865 [Solirubrobacterales bacterium]